MPDEIQQAILDGKMSEGHARPILMLTEKDEEQHTLFKDILYKKLTVREAEGIARRIATDRVRNKKYAIDPEVIALEKQLTETLGTRVQIEQREEGGMVHIDYFSVEDLRSILDKIEGDIAEAAAGVLSTDSEENKEETEENKGGGFTPTPELSGVSSQSERGFIEKLVSFTKEPKNTEPLQDENIPEEVTGDMTAEQLDDRSEEEIEEDENDEDLYSVKNFSV